MKDLPKVLTLFKDRECLTPQSPPSWGANLFFGFFDAEKNNIKRAKKMMRIILGDGRRYKNSSYFTFKIPE